MKIGVLGGIGPESTSLFYSKLISKIQEKGYIKDNTCFPQIIINSIPAPEILKTRNLGEYIRGLKELEIMNVDFIVMVCNTIHIYYDLLQRKIKTPIIDVRSEVKKELKKNYLVIGSANTIKSGLYRSKNSVEPKEVDELNNAIIRFNKGEKREVKKVNQICARYKTELILLACTEFAVMLKNKKNTVNTIDIMVKATLRKLFSEFKDKSFSNYN